NFCCVGLESLLGLSQENDEDSSLISSSKSLPASQNSSRLKHESTELMLCVHYLTSVPQAFIIDHESAVSLVDMLLGFLTKYQGDSGAHQAFMALNATIDAISVNHLELSARVAEHVIPIVSRFWDTKLTVVKDQMIIS